MRSLALSFGLLLIIFLMVISPSTLPVVANPQATPPPTPETTLSPEERIALEEAIQAAVASHREEVLAFLIFDVVVEHVDISTDRMWALAWLHFIDPDTGEVIPTEPGLALAHRVGDEWQVTLQAEAQWNMQLALTPTDLLSPVSRSLAWHVPLPLPVEGLVFRGYLLPWPAGRSVRLTRSISHTSSNERYAFDFADGTMFPLHASKGGKVAYVVWNYPNGYYDGNCNHANYVVVEDTTTSPTTYAVYLHLAENSVPEPLRTRGATVYQGQFLGNVDDTGCSTGHHVHFQVHTSPYAWYGTSVDITFDDVDINGGRPRTPSEASSPSCFPSPCQGRYYYVSGNVTEATPPTGEILMPVSGSAVLSNTLQILGQAEDADNGLS
ncbi:MAG: M23 family metallopeptidase, partial [Chloroflexota bacterium]